MPSQPCSHGDALRHALTAMISQPCSPCSQGHDLTAMLPRGCSQPCSHRHALRAMLSAMPSQPCSQGPFSLTAILSVPSLLTCMISRLCHPLSCLSPHVFYA